MPHVLVKLWPGESESRKKRLADAITRNIMEILDLGEESVSVSMQEIAARDWAEQVYKTEILRHPEQLYKKPGYNLKDL